MTIRIVILLLIFFISLPAFAETETKYQANWVITCKKINGEIVFQKYSHSEPAYGFNTNHKFITGMSIVDRSLWYFYPLSDVELICLIQTMKDFEYENK